MGRIVIACYKPKSGKSEALLELVKNHVDALRKENLVTDRNPIIFKSESETIIEVFEWKSKEAIDQAHANPKVMEIWEAFSEVCDYEIPVNMKEFQNIFSEFEPIN